MFFAEQRQMKKLEKNKDVTLSTLTISERRGNFQKLVEKVGIWQPFRV
jgi:hypothetical protein